MIDFFSFKYFKIFPRQHCADRTYVEEKIAAHCMKKFQNLIKLLHFEVGVPQVSIAKIGHGKALW